MNNGTQNFLLKAAGLGIVTFIILIAFYTQELTNYVFPAIWNTAQLAVFGAIFIGLSWGKLQSLPEFKLNMQKSAILAIIAAIFLGARYVFFTMPYRTVLTVIGLVSLALAVYGIDLAKAMLKDYQKEIAMTAVAAIVIEAIIIVTNLQMVFRGML